MNRKPLNGKEKKSFFLGIQSRIEFENMSNLQLILLIFGIILEIVICRYTLHRQI